MKNQLQKNTGLLYRVLKNLPDDKKFDGLANSISLVIDENEAIINGTDENREIRKVVAEVLIDAVRSVQIAPLKTSSEVHQPDSKCPISTDLILHRS